MTVSSQHERPQDGQQHKQNFADRKQELEIAKNNWYQAHHRTSCETGYNSSRMGDDGVRPEGVD